MLKLLKLLAYTVAIAACSDAPSTAQAPFTSTAVAEFNEPWAMAFLPDGRLLVTERRGALKLYAIDGGLNGDVTKDPVGGIDNPPFAGQILFFG